MFDPDILIMILLGVMLRVGGWFISYIVPLLTLFLAFRIWRDK